MQRRGRLSLTTDQATHYDYDALHRRTAIVLAPGTAFERRSTVKYDGANNPIQKLHVTGLSEVLQYDQLNRLTRIDFHKDAVSGATPVLGATYESFEHDGLGRLIQAENDSATVDVAVDSLGRATAETQQSGGRLFTIAQTYDSLDDSVQVAYPSGRSIALR